MLHFTLYDAILVGVIALLYFGFTGVVIVKGRELAKEDPPTYRKKRTRRKHS